MSSSLIVLAARALAVVVLALGVSVAAAQPYPSKAIRIIVPFPPGGSTDIFARTIGAKLAVALKQQVIIDNRGGAGGSIGADAAAKSPPDGYTLLMGHIGTLGSIRDDPKLPYDAKSLRPSRWWRPSPTSWSRTRCNPSIAWPSWWRTQANPGKLSYGSGGNGSAAHIAFELFKQQTQVDIDHIP